MNRIKVRKANNSDIEEIYTWRNDPKTKKMSKNKNAINLDEHKIWFSRIKNDKNSLILICKEININKKIGVVFFNLNETKKTSKISINLDPIKRRKGYGSECLANSIDYFKDKFKDCETILAEIKKENAASKKIFEKMGFTKTTLKNNILLFRLSIK